MWQKHKTKKRGRIKESEAEFVRIHKRMSAKSIHQKGKVSIEARRLDDHSFELANGRCGLYPRSDDDVKSSLHIGSVFGEFIQDLKLSDNLKLHFILQKNSSTLSPGTLFRYQSWDPVDESDEEWSQEVWCSQFELTEPINLRHRVKLD